MPMSPTPPSHRRSKDPVVLRSALKHGIEEPDIRHALCFPASETELREDPPKWLYTGYSTSGAALEIIVVTNHDGTQVVIHAMKLRPQYHRRKNRP